MHMSDALISPAIGGAAWVATAGGVAWSSRRLARSGDERRIPLMGVLGAFVFAAQMVNFSIPGTGASGHLGGGLLLAALLGPSAAFLVMTSVLAVQALLFADGGLLALGCNVLNLGFATCALAYPLVFKPLAGSHPGRGRLAAASIAASVVGLQLGSLGVVLETAASGQVLLPLGPFLGLMQSIHLAIGLVEGFVTAMVLRALWAARPDLATGVRPARSSSLLLPVIALAVAAVLAAGALSRIASTSPDGLEWSLARILDGDDAVASKPAGRIHSALERAQTATAVLPDDGAAQADLPGPSFAGLVGAAVTLGFALAIGFGLRRFRKPRHAAAAAVEKTGERCS